MIGFYDELTLTSHTNVIIFKIKRYYRKYTTYYNEIYL